MPELLFQPIGGISVVTPIAVLLSVMLGLGLWLTRASWPRKTVLTALRAGSIAVLLFAMFRPTLVYTSSEQRAASIAVVVDMSRSMLLNSGAAGSKTRWQLTLDTLQASVPALKTLSEKMQVKAYVYGDKTQPVAGKDGQFDWPQAPDGDGSSMGKALEDVLRGDVDSLKYVVLLSDAAHWDPIDQDLPPQIPAARMAEMGIPLWGSPMAQSQSVGQASDLALTEMSVSPSVYVKNPLQVSGSVRVVGYVNKLITVELRAEVGGEMKVVDAQQLPIRTDGVVEKFSLTFTPETPGETKLVVAALPQPNELVQTNNEATSYVTVMKGGVKLLYVEGGLRTEQKYMRWSLAGSPNVHIEYRELDPTGARSPPSDVDEWFERGKYDAFILGDVPAKAFGLNEEQRDKRMHALRERVKEGAGLMMLGGMYGFGAGGYQESWLYLDRNRRVGGEFGFELSPVLPITIDRTERQSVNGAVVEDLHLQGPQKMVPTSQGERHYLMLLGPPDKNREVWNQLPPLEGANRFRGVAALSLVLARNPQGDPLLVTHNWGAGRVIAFAGDSTWRWWMRGHENEHRRFWRQMALYLAKKENDDGDGLWVRLPRRRFSPAARVEFTAGLNTPEGQPATDVQLQATVLFPDGRTRPLAMFRQADDFTGAFTDPAKPAGEYTIEVVAMRGASEVGRSKARFMVEDQDLELANSTPIPGLLANLAAKTNGQIVPPEQLPEALAKLAETPMNLEIETQRRVELWDNAWVLIAFVGLLSGEWFLRKRWGMV